MFTVAEEEPPQRLSGSAHGRTWLRGPFSARREVLPRRLPPSVQEEEARRAGKAMVLVGDNSELQQKHRRKWGSVQDSLLTTTWCDLEDYRAR